MPERYTEQEFLYNYEREFCRRIIPLMSALGCNRLHHPVRQGTDPAFPHEWHIGWHPGKLRDGRFKTRIVFEGADYADGEDEVLSKNTYELGEPRVWSRRVRATTKGFDVEVTARIAMEEEVWSEYQTQASFEITNRTTSKASASVEAGPAKANASVENETIATAKAAFGLDKGDRSKRTFIQEDKVSVEANEGDRFILTSEIGKEKHVTRIRENGYLQLTGHIAPSRWADDERKGGRKWLRDSRDAGDYIPFSSIENIAEFIEGRRPAEFPNMRGFHESLRGDARDFYNWVRDTNHRRVQLEKEQVRIIESAGEIATDKV